VNDHQPKPARRMATQLIHEGRITTNFEENGEALFLTSGFTYPNAELAEAVFANQVPHYQYTRFSNPTVEMLENRLAAIEGAELCRCTATGMAAVHGAMLSTLRAGDRVVSSRALFGSCHWIVSTLLPQYGIEAWAAALAQKTAMVLIESPSNPALDIVDIAGVAALAHRAGALVVVDNVFATPLLQRPFEFGADVVVYSATKHMDGQGRVLGGAILGRRTWMEEVCQPFLRNTGPALSPFNAWVILKGLETMKLRVMAQSDNALAVARYLEGQSKISRAIYPGLPSHPQHNLAMRQMDAGGTLVAFELAGGKQAAFQMMNAMKIITISNNLGDTKSLVTHPATTTHMKIGAEERARLGITDGMVRFSVGLEDKDDLIEDLAQALDHVG
jgi:O-succinylhomoserine sulfhydrylase